MAGQAALGSSTSRNRFKNIVLYATAGIGLLLVLVGLLLLSGRGEHKRKRVRFCRHFSRKKCCATWTSGVQGAQLRLSFSAIQIVAYVLGPREFALGCVVCTIIPNNASQLSS
jgi:hypothetical protein